MISILMKPVLTQVNQIQIIYTNCTHLEDAGWVIVDITYRYIQTMAYSGLHYLSDLNYLCPNSSQLYT